VDHGQPNRGTNQDAQREIGCAQGERPGPQTRRGREPAALDAQAGNKEEPPRGIDAATVAAYEKLGAIYGGWVKRESGAIGFQPGRDQAEKGLPGFRFGIFPTRNSRLSVFRSAWS